MDSDNLVAFLVPACIVMLALLIVLATNLVSVGANYQALKTVCTANAVLENK